MLDVEQSGKYVRGMEVPVTATREIIVSHSPAHRALCLDLESESATASILRLPPLLTPSTGPWSEIQGLDV